MRLTYQTGIATLIQLAVMTLLNIFNLINSSVTQCSANNDCLGNIILSTLYFMVLTFWFGFLWVLGAAAQTKRSKRMAQLLLAAELLVLVVALFNARQHTNLLGLITSLTDAH